MNKKALLNDSLLIGDDMDIEEISTRSNSGESNEYNNQDKSFIELCKKILIIAIPAMGYEFLEMLMENISLHIIGKTNNEVDLAAVGLGNAIFTTIYAIFCG